MSTVNYKHLYYFWVVAREGSVTRAAEQLHVSQPAVSAQLARLEKSLGEKLLERDGRTLRLTPAGRVALRYADEIFQLGAELRSALDSAAAGQPVTLSVGVADVLPKLLAYRLVAPLLLATPPVRLVLHEDRPERLLAALATHELDLVLSDAPVPNGVAVRAFNHLLGESDVLVFGAPALADRFGRSFPRSLRNAPFLLPAAGSSLRRGIDAWIRQHELRIRVVAEIEDSAVLKTFGQAGAGLFVAPAVVAAEVERQYAVRQIGRIPDLREKYYAISAERRVTNPAVLTLTTAARTDLFPA